MAVLYCMHGWEWSKLPKLWLVVCLFSSMKMKSTRALVCEVLWIVTKRLCGWTSGATKWNINYQAFWPLKWLVSRLERHWTIQNRHRSTTNNIARRSAFVVHHLRTMYIFDISLPMGQKVQINQTRPRECGSEDMKIQKLELLTFLLDKNFRIIQKYVRTKISSYMVPSMKLTPRCLAILLHGKP